MPDVAVSLMMKWQPAEERQPADTATDAADGEAARAAAASSRKGSPHSAYATGASDSTRHATSARLYSPPRKEARHALCLRDKLPLRADAALSSKQVGHLAANQMVEIIDKVTLGNGLLRARVGKLSSPRGLVLQPLGWATVTTAQEESLMRMLSPEEYQDIEWRRDAEMRRDRMDRDLSTYRFGSMATRIAQRRRENLAGRKNFQRGLSVTEQVGPASQ